MCARRRRAQSSFRGHRDRLREARRRRDSRIVNSPLSTRVLLVASGAAILLCVVAGPFGTGALPLATRTLV
jgi:hypothetical protein